MSFTMSDVKKKILERSGFRVHVRKVMNDVKELLNKGDLESVQLKLKSQKINLGKHQKEIAFLDQEIAELLQADAIEKEILERCGFNTSLQETILLITSCLSSPKQEANDVEETVTLPSANFPAQNGAKGTNKAKLPKLTLPKFTGDATEWTTFWDSFSSAIHTSEDLNEVDKFQIIIGGRCSRNHFWFTSHKLKLQPCGRSPKQSVRKQTSYHL